MIKNTTRNVLVTALGERTYDIAAAIRDSARSRNITQARVKFEMWRLARGKQEIDAMRYFHFGLHRPEVTNADIVLGDNGLCIIELNANPSQAVYQRAYQKGILNPQFTARFKAALAARGVKDPRKALPFL